MIAWILPCLSLLSIPGNRQADELGGARAYVLAPRIPLWSHRNFPETAPIQNNTNVPQIPYKTLQMHRKFIQNALSE